MEFKGENGIQRREYNSKDRMKFKRENIQREKNKQFKA